jgi:polysaccharide deacetylase family protein (PEP-CTERM system associated)
MTTTHRLPATHIFTVDVEEHFQVSAFERVVSRAQWGSLPSRIERNTDVLLDLLARRGVAGTFFTLGWIAERHPGVVRRISEAGHEVASHGWWHRRVTSLTRDEFRHEIRSSREILEDTSGQPVLGFRAPSFSITPGTEWAFDILLEEGYRYDSSLFPIQRPGYGYPSAPPIPHVIQRPAGTLYELPMATITYAGFRIPAAGGAYLRHFPYSLVRRAFREHTQCGVPALFYIHPWEIDPEQPRLRASWLTRARHYGGLTKTLPRLEQLLAEFRFTSAARSLGLCTPRLYQSGGPAVAPL